MAAPPPPPERPTHPGALRAWLVWWVLLAALWLALVDTVAAPELVAGAFAAAVAASGAVVVRSRRRVLLRPRPRWLLAAGPAAMRAVTDLRPLAVTLWRAAVLRRPAPGRLTEVPYAAVGDDPREAAHRAWTEALGSLAPNTVVVDIDARRQTMVVHQLVPTDDPRSAAQPLPAP